MPLLPPFKSWSRTFLCGVALMATILLHAAIFGLLSIRSTVDKTGERHAAAACISFCPDGEHGEWEKQLSLFCDIHDPGLLSEANPKHGFSTWLAEAAPRPLSNTSLPPPVPVKQQPNSFPPAPMAAPLPSVPETIGGHWPSSMQKPQGDIPSKSLPAGTLWRFADGVLLAPFPEMAEEAAGKAATETPPSGASRFEVRLPQAAFQARIRLTSSCGNPKLDRLALLALSTRLRHWEQDRLSHRLDAETSRFSNDNDFTQTIEIEWRLRPGP